MFLTAIEDCARGCGRHRRPGRDGSFPGSRTTRDAGEITGFHQLCEKDDRQACVRIGILIGRNEQRNEEHHTDWLRFERWTST